MSEPIRILFVCLGNICRSPTAEGVFRHLVEEAKLDDRFEIDSAGTGDWHVGEPADRRMRQAAAKQGIKLGSISRQIEHSDFGEFDHILAMDRDNLADMNRICPKEHRHKIRLLRDYDAPGSDKDVPDPYYGGADGFRVVVGIVEECCKSLLEELQKGTA